ncbi:restriction endonuclease subunit S [Vreelandella zhaodongensis]|uniref:restriction endonuclease subunit S n=1 Tax=Vreelandella zhaodongensis TaxID=1176240 RepID=UPI003EBA26AD
MLRISSVRPFSVDQVDIRYLEVSEKDKERYSLKPDDLLFTRYNGSIDFVGVCARVKQLDHNILLYPDKLIRVRVDEKQIIPSFLELFAASYEAREYIYSLVKSTSGQKGISGKDLKLMKVELPSILEQTEIVRRVDQLFTHADRIEQQVNQALARVNNLTQSILAKAFRGELTEQWRKDNPELISGENSAEALLERIKAERAAKAPAKRTRKKATA